MKIYTSLIILLVFYSCSSPSTEDENKRFNRETDLLLLHYDCKTDVDDLHAAAAAASLLKSPEYSEIAYHAVLGTYGTQEGLYVPGDELFNLAFGNNWSNAHEAIDQSVQNVASLAVQHIESGGNIWIAEGGQSDFSAKVIESVRNTLPEVNTTARVHVIQHSTWNEEVTTLKLMEYARQHATYIKIPDGNGAGNGSPSFREETKTNLLDSIADKSIHQIWKKAVDLANTYNGAEDRYLNTAIAAGGYDFSDFVEVWYILEPKNAESGDEFLKNYVMK